MKVSSRLNLPEDQVEGRLLLDVVVRKGAAILELLSGEDETLLVWGNTFLVLDLGLDLYSKHAESAKCIEGRVKVGSEKTNVVDGVGRLNLEGDLQQCTM